MTTKLKYSVLLKLDKDFIKALDEWCKESYPDECCKPCARARAVEEICSKVIKSDKSKRTHKDIRPGYYGKTRTVMKDSK